MGVPVEPGHAVAAYKQILRTVLDQRPAGIRRRLADVLCKNRSFITHLSNPTYSTETSRAAGRSLRSSTHVLTDAAPSD